MEIWCFLDGAEGEQASMTKHNVVMCDDEKFLYFMTKQPTTSVTENKKISYKHLLFTNNVALLCCQTIN